MQRRKFLVDMAGVLGCSLVSLNVKAVNAALLYSPRIAASAKGVSGEFLAVISDIIIPETDTPSASQAGVPGYIQYYLADFLTPAASKEFIRDVDSLFSTDVFLTLPSEVQMQRVQELDESLGTDNELVAYRKLKELIVIGYYTSQVGATQALRYDPIPGPYKEIKLAEVGRAWL